MSTPKIVTNDDPEAQVECRVCGDTKAAKGMGGHVGSTHKLKVAEYVEKYGVEAGRDFCYSGSASKTPSAKALTIEDESLKDLTPVERRFYDDHSLELFGQVDRDPAQWPIVMSLVLELIRLSRIQRQLDKIDNPRKTDKLPDAKIIDAIVRNHKNTAERIQMQMKSLGLDRESKLKNRAQVKTTPFSLFAGYEIELDRLTPQQARSLEDEERKLLAEVYQRRDKYYLSVAPDIVEAKEEDSGSLSSLEIERIIREADIEL